MTGVVVVTHGAEGQVTLEAAERLVGRIDGVRFVAATPGEERDGLRRRIEEAATDLDTPDVLFLVDLAGSTPDTLCCCAHVERRAVVTGVNLPMLLKLATVDRTKEPRALADELAATGRKSIQVHA